MFVHATSSSTETAANKSQRDARMSPTVLSFSGAMSTLIAASVFGYSVASCI